MAVWFFFSKFMALFPNLFEKLFKVSEVYNCKKKKAKKKADKKVHCSYTELEYGC